MDAFYVIVLSVATIILLMILTYIGVKMNDKSSDVSVYPTSSQPCPDYWVQVAGTKKCSVPPPNKPNSKSFASDTPGMSGGAIDFDNTAWENNGKSKLCNQKDWANKNNIHWDGVSNYNGC